MNTDGKKFAEELLKQEHFLPPQQYAEYRRRLDEKMARAEREERTMRRVVYVFCALIGLAYLSGFCLSLNQYVTLALPGLCVAAVLFPVCAIVLLFYFLKYRPRLHDARREGTHAILIDLER